MKLKIFSILIAFLSLAYTLPAQDKSAQHVPPATVQAQAQDTKSVPPVVTTPVSNTTATPTTSVSDTPPVQIDYSNPDSFYEEGFVGAIKAGLLAILAALGGFVPLLRRIPSKYLQSGVIIFVTLAAVATFRQGALTENLIKMLTTEFVPNFAYSGILYQTIKTILGWLGVRAPTPK